MGIGSCLAGNAVRYDGQTKPPNPHVRDISARFEMRPFCPEMGIGMGVPRPPIHLVGSDAGVRAVDVGTHSKDYTQALTAYAAGVLSLAPQLCGYILVKDSPSCGYERVKRHADNGTVVASDQQGIFAAALATADPLLPLGDDNSLCDTEFRDSFIARAYTYHDWKMVCREGISTHQLVEFYSRYADMEMARQDHSHNTLQRILADAKKGLTPQLSTHFITVLMAALGQRCDYTADQISTAGLPNDRKMDTRQNP